MIQFFWSGCVFSPKISLCSFKRIELPLLKGGLGLKNLITWNKAAFCRHIDDVLCNNDSSRVWWTANNKLGRRKFWLMDIPQHCS